MVTSLDLHDHILIVDDQESNVLLLRSILEDEGYSNIQTTMDSRQVVTLVNDFQPDLILLDLMMPHLDGYAVMDQLRLIIPVDDNLPILVLTADATSQAKQRALSMGAKDFLTKPLDQVEVLLRVKNLLKTRALYLQQKKQNRVLEEKVRDRTAQIQSQLERVEALRMINTAIAGSLDLHLTLNIALENVMTQLNVDAADVLLLNQYNQTLEYTSGRGFLSKNIERSRLRMGEGLMGRAVLEHKTVHIPNLDLATIDFVRAGLLAGEGFVTYFGIPLLAKGEIKGVLEIFHRTFHEASNEWLEFMDTLGGQIAIAVDNAQLFTNLQHSNVDLILAYDATIEGWSKALDLRDKETEGHTLRVTEMTMIMAQAMGLSEAELVHIHRGALLHDIGKMGIPDSILLKAGPLTDEETAVMHKHPDYAFELLSPIQYLRPALDIPYCHHEKCDGTGYPRGLRGEQIPLSARLFSVIDVYDALTSDRPYHKAWAVRKVNEYIQSLSGYYFDPMAVDLFFRVIVKRVSKQSRVKIKKD